VVKTVHTISGPECILDCLNNSCCRSVNYNKQNISSENKTNCELLHNVVSDQPGQWKYDENFDHYYLLNTDKVTALS
jgi:hypothetical protein